MQRFKRTICFLLALILSCCACGNAYAASTRASAYLRSYGADCYAEADGSVSVWFEVEGTGVEEVLGVLTIIIEERAPNSTEWEHVVTYLHNDYPGFLSYNNDFHYGDIDCEDTIPGYSYRAYIAFWGGGMEIGDTRYYTTDPVVARTPSN